MWLSSAFYDPRRYRAEVAYFDELRETFNDRLPIHSYAPYHPLMPKSNSVEANRAKQAAVLEAIASYQAEEAKRGEEMAHEFALANQPKPGQPGYRPPAPNVPGTPGYDPNRPQVPPPAPPGYNPPPGEPGHDPNAPQPQHSEVFIHEER